jgi:hypothetical protein
LQSEALAQRPRLCRGVFAKLFKSVKTKEKAAEKEKLPSITGNIALFMECI